MKVLFVNNARGRGGGEEFLRDLLPGLASCGIEVGLVCRPGTPLERIFRDSPAVRLHQTAWSPAAAPRALLRLARLIRREGYGLVNVQRGHDIVESWVAARLSGARPALVYTPQVPQFFRSRLALRRMDHIVTISRHIRDALVEFDPALAPRVSILYYGIDLAAFAPGRAARGWLRGRFGVPPGAVLIGTVGDLWKNQVEFLDALASIRARRPDVRYVLAGSPASSGAGEFRARAEALGLSGVVLWAGHVAKADMPAFYADLDLAVSTHRNEGFGIWILEALASGVPVVAYDAGGVRDALRGAAEGSLVAGGPAEMAAAVLARLDDRAQMARVAAAGRAWVESAHGRERMIDDYQRLFEAIGNGRRPGE